MRKITKRSAAVIAASAVAVGGAGAAWAAWTLGGETTASASAGKAKPIVVSPAQVVGDLVPGSEHNVTFSAANPNDFPVKITGVAFGVVSVDDKHKDCKGPDTVKFAANPATPSPNPAIPAKGSISFTLVKAARMVVEPAEACQGASFSFKINVNAASASATTPATPVDSIPKG